MFHCLDHVIVAVRNLDEATRQAEALFGFEASWRGHHPESGTANSLFRVANTYLELLSPQGDGAIGRAVEHALDQQGEGVVGMAFGTDDADACALGLREAGLPALDPMAGEGRSGASDAVRRWRNVLLPAEATRGPWLFGIEHLEPQDLPVGIGPQDPAACIRALDHVVLMSPDIEATKKLYGEQLGLRLALDRSFEERGIRLVFFRVGGATVEIGGRLEAEPDPDASDRFGGLAWQVADADAARRRLSGAGFDVSEVRDGFKPGTRVCTVRGEPCGVPTLLIQPVG
jgi:catechol 2,3-dioxygenase-like lactoylglutathione lyase family enzyme